MKRKTTVVLLENTILSFLVAFLLYGCGPKTIQSAMLGDHGEVAVQNLLIVPFQKGETPEAKSALKSARVAYEASDVVTHLFWQWLKENRDVKLVSETKANDAFKKLDKGFSLEFSEKLVQMGDQLGADGVLIGLVEVYEERRGKSYGVESPAAVGFLARLYRVKDGALLWEGNYYERQKSLLEDIRNFPLFLQRGGKWITARQLAAFGVGGLMESIPFFKSKKGSDAHHTSH